MSRVLVAGVILATLVPVTTARAAPPAVGKHNTLTATQGGYAEVALPRAAVFHRGSLDNGSLEVESRAPAAGIVLRRVAHLSGAPIDGPLLVALRLSAWAGGCSGPCGPADGIFVAGGEPGLETTLPAGRYRLHAVTPAGEPLTARLTFGDLDGTAAFAPAVATRVQAMSLPVIESVGTGDTAHVRFGAAFPLRHPGVAFMGAAMRHATGANRTELCFYRDFAPSAGAFGPRCPGGGQDSPGVETTGSGQMQTYVEPLLAPGVYGLGGNRQGAGTLETVGVAIELEGDPPVAAPAAAGAPSRRDTLRIVKAAGARLVGRVLRVRVRCADAGTCKGRLRLAGSARAVAISLASGAARTYSLPATRSQRRKVARRRFAVVELLQAGRRSSARVRLPR